MDLHTVEILANETKRFYSRHLSSFSQTRQRPWDGWLPILDLINPIQVPLDVLDIACGNLRFGKFLAESLPEYKVGVYAFDCCHKLASLGSGRFKVHFHKVDILSELPKDSFGKTLDVSCPKCALSVCFGFMHHIPVDVWRERLFRDMVSMTRPLGYACVSFWQFAKNKRMLEKARRTTEAGCKKLGIDLHEENGDFLLDWNGDESVFRYAHSFSDEEIARLSLAACAEGAGIAKSYLADGRDGKLNRYVILKRNVN